MRTFSSKVGNFHFAFMTIVNHLGLSLGSHSCTNSCKGTTGCFLYNFPILYTTGEHFVGHNSYNAFYSGIL